MSREKIDRLSPLNWAARIQPGGALAICIRILPHPVMYEIVALKFHISWFVFLDIASPLSYIQVTGGDGK